MTFERLYSEELNLALNSADSNTLYTTARRKSAINAAQEEFADLTECYIRQSSVVCSCNVSEYAILSSGVLVGSTDYVRLSAQGVEYHRTDSNGALTQLAGEDFPERPIQWRNRQDAGWRTSTAVTETPSGYYLRANGGSLVLGLAEPPDIGSSESGVLVVPYVAKPVEMTSTGDEPYSFGGSVRTDLRPYHRALPHYAAYTLLTIEGDNAGAQAQLQLFLGYVARYHQAKRPKGGQRVQYAKNYLRAARAGSHGRTVPGWTWTAS